MNRVTFQLTSALVLVITATEGGQLPRGQGKSVDSCEIFLNLAMSVRAPALRGDLLLKGVTLCSPVNRELRLDVLERVFQIAGQVEEKYPRDPVPIGFTDTEPATSAMASRLGVDQLSLRTRTLSILIGLDSRKARNWFETIRRPQPPVATCDDFQVARLTGYFDTLRELADHSFAPEEVAKGAKDKFIIAHLLPIRSPADVAGVVNFLTNAKLDARSLDLFLSLAAVQIDTVDSDDRAFSVQMLAEGGQNRLRVLVDKCKREGVNPTPFLAAYRSYYARQMGQARCADFVRSEPLHAREQKALDQFSAVADGYLNETGPALGAIHSKKLQDSRAPRDLVLATPQYEAWFKDLLARGTQGVGQPPAAAVFDRVANEILDWRQPDGLTNTQFFQIKALTLARLMQQARGDEELNRAATASAEFYAKAEQMQMTHSAMWLFLFKQFLSQCRGVGAPRESLLRRLEENRDPTVSVYTRLDRSLQTAPAPGAGR